VRKGGSPKVRKKAVTVVVKMFADPHLIDKVAGLHQEIMNHLRESLMKVIQIGELLDQREANFKHGEFSTWISNNFPFSVSKAHEYIRVYRERERLKEERLPEFSLKKVYALLLQHREEDPISKVKQAASLISEVKNELAIIKDPGVLGDLYQLLLDMSKVFSEMPVLAERQYRYIEKLIQDGFFKKS
jgi:hypothetical protein